MKVVCIKKPPTSIETHIEVGEVFDAFERALNPSDLYVKDKFGNFFIILNYENIIKIIKKLCHICFGILVYIMVYKRTIQSEMVVGVLDMVTYIYY